MKTILLLKGLPASGKSTFAREFLKTNDGWIRVNNDELGAMLYGQLWVEGKSNELDYTRKLIIENAMLKKRNIIVDNTNLAPKHEEYLKEIIEEHNNDQIGAKTPELYKLEIKDFTHVPLSECLKRNKLREHPVPEKVIRMMYTQYVLPNIKPKEVDKTLPKAAVFDIDGTIATMTNRSPYDATKYYDDAPIESMIDLVKMYIANNHHIIFLTGRHEAGRATTIKWLKDKAGIEPKDYTLLMRKDGDKTPDFEYKEAIFKERVEGKYHIPIWFEDRQRNVDMARNKLGINALQVGDGDF